MKKEDMYLKESMKGYAIWFKGGRKGKFKGCNYNVKIK